MANTLSNSNSKNIFSKYYFVFFFIVSAVVLLFSSWCSFLYPMTLSEDTNTIMNGARYILSGKTLYKDFFEHKGIVVYCFYGLAWWLCPNSYHGLYIFEVLFAFAHYIYTYKMLNALNPGKENDNFFFTLIACTSSYLSLCVAHGGEIEEFCLPLYSYALFHVIRYAKTNQPISIITYFIIGVHVGLIFWSKYLCLAFYIPVIIYCIWHQVKNNQRDEIFKMLFFGLVGFAFVCGAAIRYFILTDSFSEMIEIYFKENIFGYMNHDRTFVEHLVGIFTSVMSSFAFAKWNCVYILALLILENHKKYLSEHKSEMRSIITFVFFGYSSVCVMASIGGNAWAYYFMPLTVFYPIILLLAVKVYPKAKKYFLLICTAAIIASAYDVGVYYRKFQQDYRNMLEAVDIVKKSESRKLVTYDFIDKGYYFLLDELPDEYYFVLSGARKQEIFEYYTDKIRKQEFDFVVIETEADVDEKERLLVNSGYELCYQSQDGKFTELFRLIT